MTDAIKCKQSWIFLVSRNIPVGKKLLCAVAILFFFLPAKSQDIYLASSGTVSFFSATPIEDIDATSQQAVGALNVKTRSIFFKVKMTTFEFKKALMQEHFNENYMESDKYPFATFTGTINEPVDLTKDGTYNVTVTGKLNVHGVEKPRTIPGTITVKNGNVEVTTEFNVKVADHQIKIPTVVVEHIAESVKVKVDATMQPMQPDKK